jgi:hypothetical protein
MGETLKVVWAKFSNLGVVRAWRVNVIHTASSRVEKRRPGFVLFTNVFCCHRNQQSNSLNSQTYKYYKRSLIVTNKMNS